MIKQDSIQNLKHSLDIVDVIGKYINLKKSGSNYKCNCPFHGEKTPSFVVSPSKQIYHCFGCNVTGDSISFVMDYEKLTYPEAIEKLAQEYNFTLEYDKVNKKVNKKILSMINDFFMKNLDINDNALDYLKNRAVALKSIEKFQVGFAPDSRDIMNYIETNHISMQDAIDFGVIAMGENGYYSRFIQRIMFPIKDNSGNICAFGGRTISNHPAKYINSPTTKVFNKSKIFYGYYESKEYIFKSKEIIITEGYLDVIMLNQVGFYNVVATCGTALTNEHIPLLKRSHPKVILAFDGDSAGLNAAFKASNLLILNDIESKVVIFNNGIDPADMAKDGRIDELKEMFIKAKPSIPFCFEMILKKYNLNLPEDKQRAYKEANDFLLTLTPFLQGEYKKLLASMLNVDDHLIKIKSAKKDHINTSFQNSFSSKDKEDLSELSIIKTLIEIPTLIDTVLDFCNEDMFYTHKEEFISCIKDEKNNNSLTKILIRDDIVVLSEKDLHDNLILMQIKYYENLRRSTSFKNFDFKQQIAIKKKINEALANLKKYKLVRYEDFF
jgi:DNA primase